MCPPSSAAIEFFGRVAEVAEAEGHHPDLHLTNFRDVSITVSTHAVGGLRFLGFMYPKASHSYGVLLEGYVKYSGRGH